MISRDGKYLAYEDKDGISIEEIETEIVTSCREPSVSSSRIGIPTFKSSGNRW